MYIRSTILKIYHSPTFTTWATLLVKSGNVAIILPMILSHFTEMEIKIWFLFQLIFSLKDLLDFGLTGNFSRSYAYAFAGSKSLIDTKESLNETNIKLLSTIHSVSNKIYKYIGLISLLFIAIFGTLAVYNSISVVNKQNEYWLSWGIIVFITPITLYGNLYTSFLSGINKVALIKRWDTFFSLLLIISSVVTIYIYPSILALVCVTFFWHLTTVIRNFYLSKLYVKTFDFKDVNQHMFKDVWSVIYPQAKRDFIGAFSGFGLQKVLDIVIANIVDVSLSASYLLATRLIEQMKALSGVPFFTKIPYFAKDYVVKPKHEYVKIIQKAMFLSMFLLCLGFIFFDFFNKRILSLIGSNVEFVSSELWYLLCLFAVIERYTYMHAQQYTISTNKIISHIGLPISGVLTILVFYILYPYLHLNALPISGLIAFSSFYLWYASSKSFRTIQIPFLSFELKSLFPVILMLLCWLFYNLYN